MQSLTEKLRGIREDNDLTQAQVAAVLGTSQTMYARYERGANALPLRHLITLCRFYNVSADYFLGTKPDNSRPIKRCLPNQLAAIVQNLAFARSFLWEEV